MSILLTCAHAEFLEEAPERQAERLMAFPGLSCRIEQQGGPYAECAASGELRLFGFPLRSVVTMADAGERGLSADLEADPAVVAAAAGKALGIDFLQDGIGSSASYTFDDGNHRYGIDRSSPGWTSFGCTVPARAESARLPHEVPSGAALLSGRLTYPSEYIPAMRVCAVDSNEPARGYCAQTTQGDGAFRLAVPPGRWWVLAWPRDTGVYDPPARYSEATECLAAAAAGCSDHRLRAVSVVAGEHRSDVDLLDWWNDEAMDPSPMEPYGEAMPR